MENEELDLTLKLGLPNQTVDTRLSLTTPGNTDQGAIAAVGSGDNNGGHEMVSLRQRVSGNDAAESSNVDVNVRVYSYVFTHFAGAGETLNFAPYQWPPSSVTPQVSHLNSSLATANAWNANADAAGTSGSGGSIEEVRMCTNRNCNALNTPLWRRGPLGPKSLCNACGIKYRKEEERRNKRD